MSDEEPPRKRRMGMIWVGIGLFAVFGARHLREWYPRSRDSTPRPAVAAVAPAREAPRGPRAASDPQLLEELASRLASEPTDPRWSAQAENDLGQLLAAGQPGTRALAVSCRRTVCLGRFAHRGPKEREEFIDHLPSFMDFARSGDAMETSVYFERQR